MKTRKHTYTNIKGNQETAVLKIIKDKCYLYLTDKKGDYPAASFPKENFNKVNIPYIVEPFSFGFKSEIEVSTAEYKEFFDFVKNIDFDEKLNKDLFL